MLNTTRSRRTENHRVLGRLVVALGDAEQSDVSVLTEIETRRADQIANVFNEQQVESRQGQLMQRPMHELGIEVTGGRPW